jgi:UDP-N-acetylglucosamine:LPS N-acetylglucosamine transferase
MKTILVSACTEGNGHLTQALALKEHLNKEEYEIVSAVVSNKKKRYTSIL